MVKGRDPVVDIESTGNECKEDSRNEHVTASKRAQSVLKSLGLALSFKGTNEVDQRLMKTSADECNDIESLTNNSKFEGEKKEHNQHVVKIQLKEKHKIRNSKKPPRPRKGPSLTTSDLRLVKEISELVMKKRARIARMKSLKKLRALSARPSLSSSSSSSKLSLFSMVVTALFLIIIIFQGFGSSKSSTLNFSGTLKPSQFGSEPRTMVE